MNLRSAAALPAADGSARSAPPARTKAAATAAALLQERRMRKLALIAVLMLAALASAQTRPITFEDLAAVRRIGAPKLSPDGKWIAYDVSTIDLPGNIRKSAIHLMRA